jgi:hypothetical protein
MSIAPRPLIRNMSKFTFALAAIVMFSLSVAGNANAAEYRYWTFWTQEGDSWVFSPVGSASTNPPEGSAQAWRFDATSPSVPGVPPADSPSAVFERACSDVLPIVGTKRVAIVIDSGDPALSPEGEVPPAPTAYCAVGKLDTHGYDLLKTVVKLRTDNGFICGISGYPASECATPVADYVVSTAPQSITEEIVPDVARDAALASTDTTMAQLGSAIVIGLLAVAGFFFWRRSKS